MYRQPEPERQPRLAISAARKACSLKAEPGRRKPVSVESPPRSMAALRGPDAKQRFVPWSTATLAAVALWIAAIPGAASALELDRVELMGGELWRLLSGHFAHWSGDHLLWDVLALLMLGSVAERVSRARVWVTVFVSALAISCVFLLYRPELASYRGLSGIDSAFVGFLLAHGWLQARRGDRWLRWLVVLASALFTFKIGYECLDGGMLFVDGAATAMTVVPEAHGVGLLAGIAVRLWRPAGKPTSTHTSSSESNITKLEEVRSTRQWAFQRLPQPRTRVKNRIFRSKPNVQCFK